MSTLLAANEVGKRFGGIEALSAISLTIARVEI
jgi:ABC-type branched-subunit amino acid transport system ATPase component